MTRSIFYAENRLHPPPECGTILLKEREMPKITSVILGGGSKPRPARTNTPTKFHWEGNL